MERLNELSREFFKFKRESLMQVEGRTLTEYMCILSITYEIIRQAVDQGKDVEGNTLTASEKKYLQSAKERVLSEINALNEENEEEGEGD